MSMMKHHLAGWPVAGSAAAPCGLVQINAIGLGGGPVLAVLVDINR